MNKKGFTLIELLITIGILAVLATVVVLVLNPAELFRQARDSRRISDLAGINDAIVLYLVLESNPSIGGTACQNGFWATAAGAIEQFAGALSQHPATGTTVDGSGWIPINFTSLTAVGGSPLSSLPVDPVNNPNFDQNGDATVTKDEQLVYKYHCETTASPCDADTCYEINANMESEKYSNGGSHDMESTDGGSILDRNLLIYEVGTKLDQ